MWSKIICGEEPITTTTITATSETFTTTCENSTTTTTKETTTTPTATLTALFYDNVTSDWQDGKFIECNKCRSK